MPLSLGDEGHTKIGCERYSKWVEKCISKHPTSRCAPGDLALRRPPGLCSRTVDSGSFCTKTLVSGGPVGSPGGLSSLAEEDFGMSVGLDPWVVCATNADGTSWPWHKRSDITKMDTKSIC